MTNPDNFFWAYDKIVCSKQKPTHVRRELVRQQVRMATWSLLDGLLEASVGIISLGIVSPVVTGKLFSMSLKLLGNKKLLGWRGWMAGQLPLRPFA